MSNIFRKNLYKAIRRRLLFIFNPWYIIRSLKKRQGECGDCYDCCEINFFTYKGDCKYLKDRKCSVYKTNKMPTLCWLYPFDKKDIWEENKDSCRFKWEK